MNGSEACSALDIERILMDFRELRCSSVNHMAIQDARTSLLEIQRTMQNQFLTLTMGFLALVLAVIQTIVVTVTTDNSIRLTSFILILVAGILVGLYAINYIKTGREAKRHTVIQKINSARDAKSEYEALKITAEENLLPVVEASAEEGRITQQRHVVVKKRIEEAISFFNKKISEKEKELKVLEEDKKRLETDC